MDFLETEKIWQLGKLVYVAGQRRLISSFMLHASHYANQSDL